MLQPRRRYAGRPAVHLGGFLGGFAGGTNSLRRYIYESLQPEYLGERPAPPACSRSNKDFNGLYALAQGCKSIGRILEALKAAGLEEDTLVVFTSDHGDFAGRYGQLGKNLPAYDPLLRIPFIWYDPKRAGAGERCVNEFCSNVDFLPSLLARPGIAAPPTVQGESFLPQIDGFPMPRREAVFAETPMEKTIRTRDWKLTFFVRHPRQGQLFKMGARPDEITNYWDDPAYAHIQKDLMQRLMEWMVRCEQPHNSCREWELHVDTPWYAWLLKQPNGSEQPDRAPKNGR